MEQLTSPAARTSPTDTSSPGAVRARVATAAIFCLNGFVFASWALHIPFVRDKLDLSAGVLGFTLLAIAVGSLVSMPPTGGLIARYGSRRLTRLLALLNPLTLPFLLLAPNLWTLIPALFVYGAVTGALDVSMNAQGVAVERRLGRPILSSFHAWWSFGSLGGAGLGTLALGAGLGVLPHVLIVAAAMFLVALLCGPALLPRSADVRDEDQGAREEAPRQSSWRPSPSILLLGALGFLGLLGEGAVADWSAVYYRDALGSGAARAGWGFVAFSLCMTLGRTFGDAWRARLGDARLLRLGAALSGVGLLAALLTRSPLLAALGFGAFGLGIANIVPVLFSAAGNTKDAGRGIAQVSTLGYLGFLAGPPLIGLIAQGANITVGLIFVGASVLVIALLSGTAMRAAAGETAGVRAAE